jgi:hypothetical protein
MTSLSRGMGAGGVGRRENILSDECRGVSGTPDPVTLLERVRRCNARLRRGPSRLGF